MQTRPFPTNIPGDVLPAAGPPSLAILTASGALPRPRYPGDQSPHPLGRPSYRANLFAAASHTTVNDLVNGINRIRLKTDQDYYNTGVLLMDLDRGRTDIHPQEIFQHVQEHGSELLLPDQDVFNTLYGAKPFGLTMPYGTMMPGITPVICSAATAPTTWTG